MGRETRGFEQLCNIKTELQEHLKKRLVKGDSWYLIGTKWFSKMKKYLGLYEFSEQRETFSNFFHPGPIDNWPLFNSDMSDIRNGLILHLNYEIVPEEAWFLLVNQFGYVKKPLKRTVIEYGNFVKHQKVEVYLTEIKIAEKGNPDDTRIKKFSKSDTLEQVVKVMKTEFNIASRSEIQIWFKNEVNELEKLSCLDLDNTVHEFFDGMFLLIEVKQDDGPPPAKSRRLDDSINSVSSELECPVCYIIPRDIPIPQCSKGHIVCQGCRKSVTICPTCREPYSEANMNSSLAAKLIEKIPHQCKFTEYGCEKKDFLDQLKLHEQKCNDRTVKCPICKQVVQMKCFNEHTKNSGCALPIGSAFNLFHDLKLLMSDGYLEWDGFSKRKDDCEEFDLKKKKRKVFSFPFFNETFYWFFKYDPQSKMFFFTVLLAKDPENVEKYSAKLTLSNGDDLPRKEISALLPVMPIEQYPERQVELLNSDHNWHLPYSMFRKYFFMKEKVENNQRVWTVFVNFKLEIFKKND